MIYVTPQGRVFNQQMAAEFAKCDDLIFYVDTMKVLTSACWRRR